MVESNVWQIIDESQDFPQINKSRKGSNSWSISFQLRIIKQIHELIIFIYLFIYSWTYYKYSIDSICFKYLSPKNDRNNAFLLLPKLDQHPHFPSENPGYQCKQKVNWNEGQVHDSHV